MAKRIQMRKNRFLALQKMAEQKKNEALNNAAAAMGEDANTLPKQTEIRINLNDPKAAAIRLGASGPGGKGVGGGMVAMPPVGGGPVVGGGGTVGPPHMGLMHGSPPPLPHSNHHLMQMQAAHHLLGKHHSRSRPDLEDQDYGGGGGQGPPPPPPPMQQSNHVMGHVAFNNNQGPGPPGPGSGPSMNHLNNNGAGMQPHQHHNAMGPPPPQQHGPPPGAQQIQCKKNLQKMMGISPSDIDKYSRIFFPVTFICFNLMYWIIYLHVSDEIAEDLVMLGTD